MSKIDQQIKALMLKKSKIDYIKYIEDLLVNDKNCIDFKDVKDEVLKEILPHLEKVAESIETDTPVKKESNPLESFSPEQLKALVELSDRYIATKNAKPEAPKQNNQPYQPDTQQPTPAKRQELSNNDKMNFAMNHRHLANKRVQVMNDKNVEIQGLVVGLDAPYVQVKTDTGPTINVPIEKIATI